MSSKESRTGLNHQTNKRMTLKPEMISGVFLGIIFIVITLNSKYVSMCLKRCPSLYHSNTLVKSGARTRHLGDLRASSIDDYWNVDGGRELSGPWTTITQFTILNE